MMTAYLTGPFFEEFRARFCSKHLLVLALLVTIGGGHLASADSSLEQAVNCNRSFRGPFLSGFQGLPQRQIQPQYRILDPLGGVNRYSSQELANMNLTLVGGVILNSEGQPANTTHITPNGERFSDPVNFVATREGHFFVFPSHRMQQSNDRHSSFSRDAVMAGEIVIENGVIVAINNISGHFMFNTQEFLVFVETLQQLGFPISENAVRPFTRIEIFRDRFNHF